MFGILFYVVTMLVKHYKINLTGEKTQPVTPEEQIQGLMNQLLGERDNEKRLEISRQIISLKPSLPHYYYNHAMCCADFGLWHEATDVLEKARDLLPGCPIIRRVLSVGLLATGRFREGFSEFEWRFKRPLPNSVESLAYPVYEAAWRLGASYEKPFWDGKDSLEGKKILVFNEGGFGDIIQNTRYLPLLKERGAYVVLEAQPEVKKVLEKSPGIDEIFAGGKKFDKIFLKEDNAVCSRMDYCVSINSLPYFFTPDLDHIPFEFPYVFPQEENCEAVDIVRKCNAELKIGITWAGNLGHGNDHRRSTYKRNFLPLCGDGIQLFGLQKGDMKRGDIDLMEGGEVLNSIDLGEMLGDFNDTALVLRELDCLVSIDTSIAHLAGAMGVPLWTALPFRCWTEWRWQKHWYSSQRVIHQETENGWLESMGRIKKEILAWKAF
jgi:hypothetical protein